MYAFSKQSRLYLATCHADIRNVFNTVIKFRDCTIIEGHRPEERQDEMYRTGMSQLSWPQSKHNNQPSLAVDVAPYFAGHDPAIDWNDREKFVYFAGFVLGVASRMNIKLRFGGDWNMDNNLRDNRFQDLGHFGIVD